MSNVLEKPDPYLNGQLESSADLAQLSSLGQQDHRPTGSRDVAIFVCPSHSATTPGTQTTLRIFIPSFFLENFSILETHLTWLCICSVFVTAINLVLYLVVKPNASSKRSSLSYKVTRFLKCCIYFLMSCFFFHVIFVLYGAPLIELVLETFLFAIILSTFTTLSCLCLLGPNIKACIRVFSRNGVTSILENSLQITTISSFIGTWLGAFPIPLDWERPWQVWPISCTFGATYGYVAGLMISPLW
ncbi:hypothetical protein GH733_002203, partial [Mirounga leonina]